MIAVKDHAEGCVLPVRAQPGAKKNAVIGIRAGALRVAVSAAPERGKANEAIRSVLSEGLDCKPSQITILSGETSRDKRFLIVGIDSAELIRRIHRLLPEEKPAE